MRRNARMYLGHAEIEGSEPSPGSILKSRELESSSKVYSEIDHLVNLDPGDRGNRRLYEAAYTGEPLVEAAASELYAAADEGGRVLLTTGFPILPDAEPESDGPPGAIALSKAVEEAGGEAVLLVEPPVADAVEDLADVVDASPEIETLPPDAGESDIEDVFRGYSPDVVAAVERPGRTGDGSFRSMTADDVSSHVFPADALFEAADEDVSTVAVGDGGNEVGMGGVRDAVEAYVRHGDTVAAVTAADAVVVAGVSNWGAYGVVAALSLLMEQNLLHSGDTERRLVTTCVDSGCVDGVTAEATESVDGVDADVHASVVELLHGVVEEALD